LNEFGKGGRGWEKRKGNRSWILGSWVFCLGLWIFGSWVFVSLCLWSLGQVLGLGSLGLRARGLGLGAWGFGARAIEKANTRIERKNINANQILD